jgi:ankyrin repeat protein
VAVLLSARAHVNAASASVTPLLAAASGGHTAIVAALLQARADLEARDDEGAQRHAALRRSCARLARLPMLMHARALGCAGRTALLRSTQSGMAAVSALLVSAKADINTRAMDGNTPLTWCASEVRAPAVLVREPVCLRPWTRRAPRSSRACS